MSAGFPNKTASQLVGAIIELYDNIYEHSEAAETGLVAFRASPGKFEFVISDLGIGVLASLKSCEEYNYLNDHEGALSIALSEGGSRFGSGTGRGMGYRQLFVGLANLTAKLRFRSGDHAITIDGPRPALIDSKSARKPLIRGLFVSVACYLSS